MSVTRTLKFWGWAALLGAVAVLPGHAQSVLIGGAGDPNNGNMYPFGLQSAGRYQQVYSSTAFSGPLLINQISFFNADYLPGSLNAATYTFSLSTTAKSINGLDAVNYNANVGANSQTFYTGTLSGPVDPVSHVFTITGTTFTYNPAAGNLLLDITKSAGTDFAQVYLDARNGDFGTVSSRVTTFGGVGNGDNASYGLVTRFGSNPSALLSTPEPSSVAAFGVTALGVAGLILRARKRKATE